MRSLVIIKPVTNHVLLLVFSVFILGLVEVLQLVLPLGAILGKYGLQINMTKKHYIGTNDIYVGDALLAYLVYG